MDFQRSGISSSQPSQTFQAPPTSTKNWSWLHGVHHPLHSLPLQAFPTGPRRKPVKWSNDLVKRRPAFFPSNDLGYAEIKKHFPPNMLEPRQGMSQTAWWDRLIACYNMIGRIDGCQYLSDFDLRLFLQAIQEDVQHEHGLFWTPTYAMLDQDKISPLPKKAYDVVRNAGLIVHLIRFPDGDGHFAVVIYDHTCRRWIYADSWSRGREARFNLASQRLSRWLVSSKLAPAELNDDYVRKRGTIHNITEQRSPWSCGLIALDFVRAFMREGYNDWADSYFARDVEDEMIRRWLDWLRGELGHAPNTPIRVPPIPKLSHHDFIRKQWPRTKTPEPSNIEAGRSQSTPINISPPPSPPRSQRTPTSLSNTGDQSQAVIKKLQNKSRAPLAQQPYTEIHKKKINLSNSPAGAARFSPPSTSKRANQRADGEAPVIDHQKFSVGPRPQSTPYRHSVTPERNLSDKQGGRLSPSHPPDWRGWSVDESK